MSLEYWLIVQLKKDFTGKEKKINILTAFLFSIKMMSKLSQNRLLTNVIRALVSIFLLLIVNFDKSTIELHFLLYPPHLQNFQKIKDPELCHQSIFFN